MKSWKRIKQNVKHKKLHILRGEKVQVVAGKERGKTGAVLKVVKKTGRVIVEKVNMVKRHSKGTSAQNPGGIVEKEASIHISNVQPFCDKCGKGVRVSRQVKKDGSIVRQCSSCDTGLKASSR